MYDNADTLLALGYPGPQVSGMDPYVGAANVNLAAGGFDIRQALANARQAATQPQGIMVRPEIVAIASQAINERAQAERQRRIRMLALAGHLPQVAIPLSTAVGSDVAAGAAATLLAVAGVPCRITRYQVSAASAVFFDITSMTAARMDMIAGGTGGVPADMFITDATAPPLENPELGAGSPVRVVVQNRDTGSTRPYRSAFSAVDLTPGWARLT
jgi:hypothetical protein